MLDVEKKTKVKKGSLAVNVGFDDRDLQRFVIPISYLHHPSFKSLLEKTHEMYGYHTVGPLRLPCSVDDFLHLRWRIEKEGSGSGSGSGSGNGNGRHSSSYHHEFHHSLSFKSC
ncbi:hypothetical protein V2J09_007783 [Rumex salicifolius]